MENSMMKQSNPRKKLRLKIAGFSAAIRTAGSTGKCKISDLFEELGFRV